MTAERSETAPRVEAGGTIDDFATRIAADLAQIAGTRMPFGKFGPAHFPPHGVPIYDLPIEYLAWFERKQNWPRGRLGELLRIVHQMKVDGSDSAFDPMRAAAGGKTPLRTPNRRAFHFE